MNKYWKIVSEDRHNDVSAQFTCHCTYICLMLVLSCSSHASSPEAVEFNSQFLRSAVNVREFTEGNPVAPGLHHVDVYVNDHWKGRMGVLFALPSAVSRIAEPCVSLNLLSVMGLDTEQISEDNRRVLENGKSCKQLPELIPDTFVQFDVASQRLVSTIPQARLLRQPRGYVSPDLWDDGIPAALLQYDYNAYHVGYSHEQDMAAQYLGLRGGFNLGGWRLRYSSALNWSNQNGWDYNSGNAYLEHAIPRLKSRIVLGESSTDGQVFDSINFRGMMLQSEDRMYTDSQRGYAPEVRGIAYSNALVSVVQRGIKIYETTVPPGPFVINDLYPTGSSGDLLVTVKEANGVERIFTVTYASIPQLLRPGTTRYALMAGQYRNDSITMKPMLGMATVRHGFSNLLTGYGGLLGGEGYAAVSGGVGLNTTIGAFSADMTHARTTINNNQQREGQSYRVTYSKILPVTDTNVTLASYRYSGSGYYDINDAMYLRYRNFDYNIWNYNNSINRKNRLQVSILQDLPEEFGNISANASFQDYWNRSGRDTEYQVGYGRQFNKFNLYINASRARNLTTANWDNRVSVGISLPLGSNIQNAYLNTRYVQDREHNGLQNTLGGTLGEERQFSYSLFNSIDHYKQTGTQVSAGASGSWNTSYINGSANYSKGEGYQQFGASFSGGVIGIREGIVFTPVMGETIAVLQAEHAAGARVVSSNGQQLDRSGKAAVPYLNPYRQNSVELDPKGLSNDVSLNVTSQNVAPTAGAVVLLQYKTDFGYSVLLNVRSASGPNIPFGAKIIDNANNIVGYVSQGRQGLIRVKEQQGQLKILWDEAPGGECRFNYQIPAQNPVKDNLRHLDVTCR